MHSIQRVANWNRLPGNWDRLNFSEVFPSDNEYGIPTIANNGRMPSRLIEYGSKPRLRALSEKDGTAVHFFLDDYRFESVWNNPSRNIDILSNVGQVLSPDFSLWLDMPIAMQIWNVYRNRWLGCYWQERGIRVIPTVSWSMPYDFCYMGIERGSVVAISTVGVTREKSAHRYFREGFKEMLRVLEPSAIVCYGLLSSVGLVAEVPMVSFPTRWQERKGMVA